jgi:hypothetical protein
MVRFPFSIQQSTIAGADCPAAYNCGFDLDDSQVVQVPRSALLKCVVLKRVLTPQVSAGDLFTAKQVVVRLADVMEDQ